jgi:hypothetical protein
LLGGSFDSIGFSTGGAIHEFAFVMSINEIVPGLVIDYLLHGLL